MARIWPSMTDYAGAVQNPGTTFRLPALAQATFATMPPLGLPAVASGQNAVVFTAHIGGSTTAVRCFTTECADGRHRYQSLANHLRSNNVPAMAPATWADDAVELNGHVWPVVTMEWIHGQQLHEYVGDNREDSSKLSGLADEWAEACTSLRSAAVAHGDLQHGNVIVESDGRVRLIDFDGIWVQDVAGSPPSEVGHPNYQHPSRKDTGAWGWSIDWFSALGVYVALRALASDASLWDLHMGENLIFKEDDFWGDAEIWSRLEQSPDLDVRGWSQLLAEGCAHRADSPYDLPTLLNSGFKDAAGPVGAPGKNGDSMDTPGSTQAPTTDSPPPPDHPEPAGAWWDPGNMQPQNPAAGGTQPQSTPTSPAPPPTDSVPGSMNALWPTAATPAQSPHPTASERESGPGTSAGSVRPPTRERPEQHDVHSDWNDPSQATRRSAKSNLPPPSGSRLKPPPRPPSQDRQKPGSFAPPIPPRVPSRPTRHRNSAITTLGYILLFLMGLAVTIALFILLGGR